MSYIVVAASPLEGHVLPMLVIGRRLRAIGHEVTFITGSQYRRAAADAGRRSSTHFRPSTERSAT